MTTLITAVKETNSVTNQSEFPAVTCESLKAREKFQTKSNSLFAKYVPIVNIS